MQRHNLDFPRVNYKAKGYGITTLLGKLIEPFDQDAVAKRSHDKGFNDPESKYYQMTVEAIKEMWAANGERSINIGCRTDDYIGYLIDREHMVVPYELWRETHKVDDDQELLNHLHAAAKFINSIAEKDYMYFVGREIPVSWTDPQTGYMIRGRIDSLYYNAKAKKYVIVDYKTVDDLTTETMPWTNKMLGPADCYYDLKLNKFTFQLHFYKMALLDIFPNLTEDDITVCIVQLKSDAEYKVWNEAFKFNKDYVSAVFRWTIKECNVPQVEPTATAEEEIF